MNIKGTKENLLKKLGILLIVDTIFYALIFLFSPRFWETIRNPDIILNSSLGMLTFIAIFYTLFFSKKSKTELNELKDKINKVLKESEENFKYKKNQTQDRTILMDAIKDANFEIGLIKFLKVLIQVDKILYFCVLFFIISIYSYLVLNLGISSFFLLAGLVLVFHIITAWAFIFQESYDIRSKRVDLLLDETGQGHRVFKIEK